VLKVIVGIVPGPHGHRVLGVQQGEPGLIGADKLLHRLIRQNTDALDPMAGDKAILAAHHGQQKVLMLGNLERLDGVVVSLLAGLCIELQPTGIAGSHGIRVVTVDIQRAGEGTVHHREDDRQAHACRDIEHLPHQGQAVRSGGGHHARPRG